MINDVIQLLGIANPQLSLQWTFASGTVLNYDGSFGLNCNNDWYVAPCSGFLNVDRGLEKIVMPDGTTPTQGVVVKIDPQVYLRIMRMYATTIEVPVTNTFSPERPVPCYFVYTNIQNQQWGDADNPNKLGPDEGLVFAGNTLRVSGHMTIHDQYGFPIDPIAVAAAFEAFVAKFDTLESKALNSATVSATAHQIAAIAALGIANLTTIQLLTPNGAAFKTGVATFNNLFDLASADGYYQITNPGAVIDKKVPANNPDTKIGAATNGVLADNYTIRPRNGAIALPRDFLRAYVVSLNTYLLGNTPGGEQPFQNKILPVVQDNEQITLLVNGNECLSAVNSITAGPPALTLLASQVIDNDFVLPPQPAAAGNERWPAFPPVPAPQGPVAPALPIPANIKNNFVLTAHFIADPATQGEDVVATLTCPQFVHGDAIRIYNRIFNEDDGTETRGEGAGAIVNGTTAVFRLNDPFNIVNGIGQKANLNNPVLMVDVVVVNRGLFRRTFGNIQCTVGPAGALTGPETQGLANAGNVFNAVAERGISPGGISGTASAVAPIGAVNFGDFLTTTFGEGQPRNAPRYPTMARYDSMAASFNAATNNWQAFCGGTIFKKDALSNFPLMGNPGSPGGKEYSSVGVFTQNGPLAYDIARAAYRRTRYVLTRMGNFMAGAAANSWNAPAPAVAGPNNTWAAAALQTIAGNCETPELGLGFTDLSSVPDTLPQFVTQVQNAIGLGPLPPWIPAPLQPTIQGAITGVGTDPQNQRAYDEFRRELSSSVYGRRDTYWSLKDALPNARECIYIQGTFFGRTGYDGGPDVDFIELLKTMLINNPRLKLILCLGKQINYGKGYEMFEAREYKKRKEIVAYLQGDPDPVTHIRVRAHQVLAFHPNGFPMRSKVLQHQVIIIDDMWALVGSSTFRRRGMQFDGSEDIVMMDKTITNGKSAGIKAFRIGLMQEHLNLQQSNAGLTPGLQVRLNDLHEAFYAIKEVLDSGGAGLIAPVWEGDRKAITDNLFPGDDLADPGNNTFDDTNLALIAALAGLTTTPA